MGSLAFDVSSLPLGSGPGMAGMYVLPTCWGCTKDPHQYDHSLVHYSIVHAVTIANSLSVMIVLYPLSPIMTFVSRLVRLLDIIVDFAALFIVNTFCAYFTLTFVLAFFYF